MPMALRPHRIRGAIPALFLARHAIATDDAIAFLPRDTQEQATFDRLRTRGIVREGAPGRFYFDLDAHYAAADRRRRLVVPIAILVSVLIAWIATRFFRG
ncbi:hypothetical protein C8J25_101650 [Sphingomonas faeni]|uniref:Uncharacterized protein n=1 Tax=Sphingomonas faeni TaxID=185950 RepID=A0A2T5UC94_9SPHN|nr:hypothetical protein [Sphingomonas faeni]PTW49145.1 hypothetical protein C8J25_101650 [Sphingomonas faeni]